jgi:hypothetical protein
VGTPADREGPDDRIPNQRFHSNPSSSDFFERSWHKSGSPRLKFPHKVYRLSKCLHTFETSVLRRVDMASFRTAPRMQYL